MNFEEQKSYNALAIELFSDYKKIESLKNEYATWNAAWSTLQNKSKIDPEYEWEHLRKSGVKLILQTDTEFPAILREIPWSPFGIYLKGTLPNLTNALAIVGTRKASTLGKKLAARFARDIARLNITVISGLALGIDGAAHEAVVNEEKQTVAVLANGLDRVYPRYHESLAKKILALGGALVSEYPLGSPSLPQRFLERNRIVSGLTRGAIIIEAPQKSGSLATARFALEQNRDVFVIPGSVDHKNYAGSHALIKSGASLITSIEDIIQALQLETQITQYKELQYTKILKELDETQKKIITVLQGNGTGMRLETLLTEIHSSPQEIQRALAFLNIKQIITDENGLYSLV
jgi:DNA processing protein